MSYCRWGSDNFRCDLYIYEDVAGGYTTHVAANRHNEPIPEITADILKDRDAFCEQHKAQMDYLECADTKPIGLKYDGDTFRDETLEELLERVKMLREAGYNCPDEVVKDIEEEIRVEKKKDKSFRK